MIQEFKLSDLKETDFKTGINGSTIPVYFPEGLNPDEAAEYECGVWLMGRPFRAKVTREFYVSGLAVASLQDWFGLLKMNREETFEEACKYATCAGVPFMVSKEKLRELWDTYPAYTASQAIQKFGANSELLALVIQRAGAEAFFRDLESTMVSEEVITKTQKRRRIKPEFANPDIPTMFRGDIKSPSLDMMEEQEVTFTETYRIHKLDRKNFLNFLPANAPDIHLVEVQCPSTGHLAYLFIDPRLEQCKTPIGAVAWSLNLTRQQYLTQLESES